MSDRIVMLIIMRIKYRFLNYSLAPNANRAHCGYRNKENEMDKKLIQQLLDDDETRDQIALMIDEVGTSPEFRGIVIQEIVRKSLDKLNNTPVKGEVITIEVSDHMWARGEYLDTLTDGQVAVGNGVGPWITVYKGKRVELVVKGEEGKADV
jgi:hypothetical protein